MVAYLAENYVQSSALLDWHFTRRLVPLALSHRRHV
ncbi:MAG: hypothetical protein ACI87C_000406 [Paraperlucidibaca sp.]|jgi:hypothetical protein